ncbi:hypothetical protein HNV23_08920 [Bacillus paranthracis]|uniref:hypothetical protein n=1 Tax=Bacillus paranthracis TaxID=2026186 RepID=UPI00148F1BCB|nr:hypothetical protein [Bacillus paranthracis]NOP79606.1 hypothetical protein [Bacillus paranthracis]
MKTVKALIFLLGICLANFVGGIPTDARNLFITHTIFFAPYLVDFYPMLSLKSFLKWVIRPIWVAGIIVFAANMLGIAGVITVQDSEEVVFSESYYSPFSLDWSINNYLLILSLVYVTVFVGSLTLGHLVKVDDKLVQKAKEKEGEKEKDKGKGKGMVEHVSSR